MRSNRRARGTAGGLESIRASALHSSPSLLFCNGGGEKKESFLKPDLLESGRKHTSGSQPRLRRRYLSVGLPGGRMGQARGRMARAGRRGGGQRGGGDGGSHVSPADAVPSSQGGWGERRGVQGHAADPALDLFRPQLRVFLLLLNQPGRKRGKASLSLSHQNAAVKDRQAQFDLYPKSKV